MDTYKIPSGKWIHHGEDFWEAFACNMAEERRLLAELPLDFTVTIRQIDTDCEGDDIYPDGMRRGILARRMAPPDLMF